MDLVSGNIFIRPNVLQLIGDKIDGHAHNFDHTTYVIRGSVRVEQLDADGNVVRTVDKKASEGHNWVLIKAGVIHRLTALEDDSEFHCIYSHRDAQGDVVLEATGWTEAYL